MRDTAKRTKRLFFKATLLVLLCLGILCVVVKEVIEDRQSKRAIAADPYVQSVFRAGDAVTMVRGRSFAELDHHDQQKVVMKCAEAYALATLPSAQPPDDGPDFQRYLHGLSIAQTQYRSQNVKQIDHAFDMIRDYLWSQYGDY